MQTNADRTNLEIRQRPPAIITAADHAARAHKGQLLRSRRTPSLIHLKVVAIVGMSGRT